jgi:hypothetical protein
MTRVLRPGGRLAVALATRWIALPGYAALARLLDQLFGTRVGDRAPFALGDPDQLHALCREAGIADAAVMRHHRDVCFESIDILASTPERACVWTLGGVLDEEEFARLLHRMRRCGPSWLAGRPSNSTCRR